MKVRDTTRLVTTANSMMIMLTAVDVCYFLITHYVLTLNRTNGFPTTVGIATRCFPGGSQTCTASVFGTKTSVNTLVTPLDVPLLTGT